MVARDLRGELEARLGPERLEHRLRSLREESGGLLTDEAMIALIADEEGLSEATLSPLGGLRPDAPVNARCTVDSIGPTREFVGRGGPGRVRRVALADGTGRLALVLWDEDTELVEGLGLAPGSRVRVLSATLKDGRFGPEIHLGRSGFLLHEAPGPTEGPPAPANIDQLAGLSGRVTVRGVILSISPSGRGRARSLVARVFDGTGECVVDMSGAPPEGTEGLAPGREVELSGAIVERGGGAPSLRCDRSSRVRMV